MPAFPPIRAVFFDAVGTLIHPTPPAPEMYARVAAHYGLNVSAVEVRRRFVAAFREEEAVDRAANWVTSEAREEARWRRVVAETLPDVADAEGCFRTLYDHYAQPSAWVVDPNAGEVFAALRDRGFILGLASNYDHRLESVIEGHTELRSLRPNIVISSQVGKRKPGGAFFAALLRTVGLSPQEVLLVGDDVENDCLGATAAGLRAILLDPQDRHPQIEGRIATLGQLVHSPQLG